MLMNARKNLYDLKLSPHKTYLPNFLVCNAGVNVIGPNNIILWLSVNFKSPSFRYIPATDSPNGKPLLAVSGTMSGTVTLLQLNVELKGGMLWYSIILCNNTNSVRTACTSC